jgi:hypothetical protein
LTVISKLIDLFNQDPKPIFDHVRNIGIATILVFGGRIAVDKSEELEGGIYLLSSFFSGSIVVIGAILFALNMNYGARSISKFLLGKHANINILRRLRKIKQVVRARRRIKKSMYVKIIIFYFKELATQLVIVVYYVVVIMIVISNTLGSGLSDLPTTNGSENLQNLVPKMSEQIKAQELKISDLETKIEFINKEEEK